MPLRARLSGVLLHRISDTPPDCALQSGAEPAGAGACPATNAQILPLTARTLPAPHADGLEAPRFGGGKTLRFTTPSLRVVVLIGAAVEGFRRR